MDMDEDDVLAAAFGALGMGGLAMNPEEAADEIMRDLEWGGEGAAAGPVAMEAEMAAPGGAAAAAAAPAPRPIRRSGRIANLQAAKAAAEQEAAAASAAAEAEKRAARNAAAAQRAELRARRSHLKLLAIRVMELHGNETPDRLEQIAAGLVGEPDAVAAIHKLAKMKRISEEQQRRPGFKEEVKEVLRGRIREAISKALSLGEVGAAEVFQAQLNSMKGGRKNRKTRRGKKRSTRRK
jgi:hypothetical protein